MDEEKDLPFIDNPQIFSAELRRLYQNRINHKEIFKSPRRKISKKEKHEIFQKTSGYCHICGGKLDENSFQIDHLFPHSFGGNCNSENFIAACGTCNNYRWNYLPEEIKWIMKIGVWAKTQIEFETPIGKEIAKGFINYENARENRRIKKRIALKIDHKLYPIRDLKAVSNILNNIKKDESKPL